jgi:hypothetical protein
MEYRPSSSRHGAPEVVASAPDGTPLARVGLSGRRVSAGRLPELNEIALQPDPELLVTRAHHCTFERDGQRWFVVDGGSVNGTYLRRGTALQRVSERVALRDGDVICVLASVADMGERRYFQLAATADSQATRAVPESPTLERACLAYDANSARLVFMRGGEAHEIRIRAQAHRLVRHMVERNAAGGGSAALCTHAELMRAVWEDEPMHTREELAKLVWELRKRLEPLGAGHLIENERRRGYRMHTCPDP